MEESPSPALNIEARNAIGETVAKAMREKVLVVDHHVSEDDLSDRWFKDTSAEATASVVPRTHCGLCPSLMW